MFQSHYLKRDARLNHGQFHNVLASIIYNLVPEDRLVTKPDILDLCDQYRQNHPDESFRPRKGDIDGCIDFLVSNSMLRKIDGSKLRQLLTNC